MFDWSINSWIIIGTGFAAAVACSVLGVFLVLRRMSLVADAISHAVLPGIAVAFLLSGSRSAIVMFVGAGAIGVIATFLIEWLHRSGRIQTDASIGVVFTALFALGVVLISAKAGMVDLDQECVLYGEIAYSPWDELIIGGRSFGSRPLIFLSLMAVVNLIFVSIFYKELKVSTFDPALASSLGFSAVGIHYALMSLVSLTTVSAFESVGAILVVAMFVVPAAAAYLLADRLPAMIGYSILISAVTAFGGYWMARRLDASIAGSMITVNGVFFLLALVFSPKHGILPRWMARTGLALRIAADDWLAHRYRLAEAGDFYWVDREASPISRTGWLPLWLRFKGMVYRDGGQWTLTDLGDSRARDIIRRHRSWEGYLHTEFDVPPDHVHRAAHEVEHYLDESIEGKEDVYAEDRRDPHGSRIPGG